MPTILVIPAFCPISGGIGNDGRKRSLVFTCQRLSDGKWLDSKNSIWGNTPTLNAMIERGRDSKGNADPKTSMLRGSYIPSVTLTFDSEDDTHGQVLVLYHDKNKDNMIIGRTLYNQSLRIAGTIKLYPVSPS